ncbi:SRPBCC family protein [Galbibacter mesophilus]|uniref:SRPBCC family protein n=1 Tax=Galbibacter mesophilus TaxID=379069 RepID=UPI00191CACF7|nr:SRPBCC family protein [Galbibacter mesophilus]MCM5664126.1 SRPBCC family protein [Galbibacter mesophilus]
MFSIILYILIGFLILGFILFLIAPKNYHVSRSIEVERPLSEVYSYLKYLKNQDEWSPWSKKDPNMHKEISGEDGTVGAVSYWKGNKEVGEGEQEITKLVPNEAIYSELRFLKPFASTSDAYLKVKAISPEATTVSWGFSGNYTFPMNIIMLFMSMDKTVGKDFEQGLKDMKSILEYSQPRKSI